MTINGPVAAAAGPTLYNLAINGPLQITNNSTVYLAAPLSRATSLSVTTSGYSGSGGVGLRCRAR